MIYILFCESDENEVTFCGVYTDSEKARQDCAKASAIHSHNLYWVEPKHPNTCEIDFTDEADGGFGQTWVP